MDKPRTNSTVVTFSSGINRLRATEFPAFSGWSTTKGLKANILRLADPTLILDTELAFAWFLGNRFQVDLSQKIRKVLKAVSKTQKIILFGSGSGGHAALMQGSKISNSTVVKSSPNIDLTKHPHFQIYADVAWQPGLKELPIDSLVTDVYREQLQTKVIFIQNKNDKDYFHDHFQPFIGTCSLKNRVITLAPHVTNDGVGAHFLNNVLATVIEEDNWGQLFRILNSKFDLDSGTRGVESDKI